jgi:hypothetical protein
MFVCGIMSLCSCGDHYQWNKAMSCVHNLLGGERWVDIYGEVTITNITNDIKCKLTFQKVFNFNYFNRTNVFTLFKPMSNLNAVFA